MLEEVPLTQHKPSLVAMRYRHYHVNRKPDGSVTVVSHGPIIAAARLLAPFWFLVLVIALFMSLFAGNWAAVGVFLLLIGICLPNFGKLKREAMQREQVDKDVESTAAAKTCAKCGTEVKRWPDWKWKLCDQCLVDRQTKRSAMKDERRTHLASLHASGVHFAQLERNMQYLRGTERPGTPKS